MQVCIANFATDEIVKEAGGFVSNSLLFLTQKFGDSEVLNLLFRLLRLM